MESFLRVDRFDARTVPELLARSAERVGQRTFLREIDPAAPESNPRTWTFGRFFAAVGATSQALASRGIGSGERVLLVAENSAGWQIVCLAAQTVRAEPAAVFATSGPEAIQEIAQRVRPACVFVSSRAQWEKLEPIAGALKDAGLRWVLTSVELGELPEGLEATLLQAVVDTPSEEAATRRRCAEVGEHDPFLLIFTSGTTGRQKGVQITQDAFVRALEGGRVATGMTERDEGLMFLPFAHIAGQCQFGLAIALGHPLILASRRQDLERGFSLAPTYVFAVPMVYDKIRTGVEGKLAERPWPVRALLERTMRAAQKVAAGESRRKRDRAVAPLAKQAIGRAVQARLGGRIRMVVSGGAAASPELSAFFEAIGIPFLSIYGMSETAGLICASSIEHPRRPGEVGLPSPDLESRFSEEGELLVRGPMLMKGYLEAEDAEGAYTEDGFFRTGDLARRVPETGMIEIVGRAKSLLVLSTGKKISPEHVETALTGGESPVHTAMLVGDGKPYASAILFVPGEAMGELGGPEEAPRRLLERIGPNLSGVSEYERPKRVLVVRGTPDEQPDLLTPSQKLKRAQVLQRYAEDLDRLAAAPSGTAGLVL